MKGWYVDARINADKTIVNEFSLKEEKGESACIKK